MAILAPIPIASAVACIVLIQLFTTWAKHRSVPGPTSAALTNFTRLFWVWQDEPFRKYIDLHKQYGPIVRYGPNAISISDASQIPTIYGFQYTYEKSDFYKVMLPYMNGKPMVGTISPMPADMHKKIKGPPSRIFANTNMLQFEAFVDNSIGLLLKRFDELFARQHKAFDFSFWSNLFAFDTMGELTFSTKYGHMEAGKDVDNIIADVEKHFQQVSLVGQIPWYDLTLRITPLQSRLFKRPDSPQVVFQMARTMERAALLKEGKVPQGLAERDILSQLMQAEAEDETLPPMVSFMWIATNIGAGSGTTANLLTSVIYYIKSNPDSYRRVMAELEAAKISFPAAFPQVQKLSYLQACIKEAERLQPGIGLHLERKVPKGGAVICGKHLAEGTVVGMNPWVVNRDKNVFGEDAEAWRPERWLVEGQKQRIMESSVLGFGAGSRVCYGSAIAHLIVSKTIASLLTSYKFKLENESNGWKIYGRWFTARSGAMVKIEKIKSC